VVALGFGDPVLANLVEQGFVADLENRGGLLAIPKSSREKAWALLFPSVLLVTERIKSLIAKDAKDSQRPQRRAGRGRYCVDEERALLCAC